MRILFCAHNFIYGNGQGRINLEIVRFALARGFAVTLVADEVDVSLLNSGAKWERVRQRPRRPNLIGVRSFVHVADQEVERLRSSHDVVVGAGYTLRVPHDVNLCQFVHGEWIRSAVHPSRTSWGAGAAYQWTFSRVNARWERQAYAAAGYVVPPSEKIRDELRRIGVSDTKLRVIYNGVDLQEFHPLVEPRLRAELGLPVGPKIGLFVGDIRTTRKNLDTVLRAMRNLPELHLCVVGDLSGSPFPAMAERLGVAARVHFVGYRRDVQRFMQACDLFVFPSRYEAGTLVLLEAAASGLPIVTATSAGGSEIFDMKSAVVLDDPNDVPKLTAAISGLADSPVRLVAAGRAARGVAERHPWTSMAEEYVELFDAQHRRGSR